MTQYTYETALDIIEGFLESAEDDLLTALQLVQSMTGKGGASRGNREDEASQVGW